MPRQPSHQRQTPAPTLHPRMDLSPLRIARDYNRRLALPVRWAHLALGAAWVLAGPAWEWLVAPGRRLWTLPLAVGAVFFAILLPLDGPISALAGRFQARGDVRRELEAVQQYGALGSLLITAGVIWLLDAGRRRRLLDLLAAVCLTGVAVMLIKALVGRPRPKFDDPHFFPGPLGVYPLGSGRGLHHAWEFWSTISSDLWSLPSSHTAYAVTLSVFLATLYPRLAPLAWALAALVGLCRVLFVAHYPTDVVAGAALGLATALPVVRGFWGVRALDWVWLRLVNPSATPAYAALARSAVSGIGTNPETSAAGGVSGSEVREGTEQESPSAAASGTGRV